MIALVDGVEGARIDPSDRGFSYGDGVFEVLRTHGGKLRTPELHLARLVASAALVGFDASPLLSALRAELDHVVARLGGDLYVRVVVTRGRGLGMTPPREVCPLRVVLAESISAAQPASIRVITVPDHPAPIPGAKTLSHVGHVVHRARARAAGADEALIVEGGLIREGVGSNVLAVVDGTLRAPIERALPGITRRIVLELARAAGLAVDEGPLGEGELGSASELFVTSTIRGLCAVSHVDDRPIPAGSVLVRLADAYARHLS